MNSWLTQISSNFSSVRIQPGIFLETVDPCSNWPFEVPARFVALFTFDIAESFYAPLPAVRVVDLGVSDSLSVEHLCRLKEQLEKMEDDLFYLDRGPFFLPALLSSFSRSARWRSVKLHSRLQTILAFDRELHSMPVAIVPIIFTSGFALCSTGLCWIVAFPLPVQNRILCFQGLSCGNAI